MPKKNKNSIIDNYKPMIISSIILSIFFSIFSLLIGQSSQSNFNNDILKGQFMINNSYQELNRIDVNQISEYEAKQIIRNIQNNI